MHSTDKYCALTVIYLALLPQDTNAANCPGKGAGRAPIASQVTALRRLEQEASDRVKGLDTRPFDVLRDEVKQVAAVIADPAALAREDELKSCRNPPPPVRRLCADAAQGLTDILDKHVASAKPDYDRPRYAATIADCEKAMGLKPLQTLLRGND